MYYRINRLSQELSRIRREQGAGLDCRQEREMLQEVEHALRDRDAMEDVHAPYGTIAEPAMNKGIAVDLRFTFGNVNAHGRPRSQPYVSEGTIDVPLPSSVRRDQLTLAPRPGTT